MPVIRGTSLLGYPEEVRELGGDPRPLLRAAGIRAGDVGDYDAFIAYPAVVRAVESAAAATGAADFGRRLARRQGIEILGPVGVAARTSATVADALGVFETYLSAYSPAIATSITPVPDTRRSFFEFRVLLPGLPPHQQVIELALGVALQVLQLMLGTSYHPLVVHLPHEPLSPPDDYRAYFGCTPRFAEGRAGFTIRSSDLARPLSQDQLVHASLLRYLDTLVRPRDGGLSTPVRELVRQLLPTGAATLQLVARQFTLHPKTLQRRLSSEGTTFAALVDQVRKEMAERYLRDTELSFTHLSRELGYAEQSVLTRSCHRWFGQGPAAHRKGLRA